MLVAVRSLLDTNVRVYADAADEPVKQRLAIYRRCELVLTSPELIAGAMEFHVLRGWSFYDALIAQAAVVSGCQRMWSENMPYDSSFGRARLENQFLKTWRSWRLRCASGVLVVSV